MDIATQAMSCGFSAVTGLSWSGGLAKAGAKMVAKAALKAAAKTLCGGVGVALTVVSFFDCMDMI